MSLISKSLVPGVHFKCIKVYTNSMHTLSKYSGLLLNVGCG